MNDKLVFAYGFSWRKRAYLRKFLGDVSIRFVGSVQRLPSGSRLYLWASSNLPEALPDSVRIVRVEDGFLRSVGLGAELARPLSWVFDTRGIYYDVSQPSDLELMLQETAFDSLLLQRAARLRKDIVSAGLSKYNVGNNLWTRPDGAACVILVPGQVESDASIKMGATEVHTNVALLQAVREANPDAYVIYKPHPDVMAGLRAKGAGEERAHAWCDEMIGDVSMGVLLQQVDEVHVMTSLTGFEALLRSKPVTCYGQPFYAGWGLTSDKVANPRRGRRIELDALVAATLILYPRYISRTSGKSISPEIALAELLAWREHSPVHPTFWRGFFRALLRRTVGVK